MLNARIHAARILLAVVHQHHSLKNAFARELSAAQVRDHSLIKELCYGTLRWYFRLQGLSELLIQKPLRKKDEDIGLLILLGLYQLLYTRIPAHAAVSETVNAARHFKKPWANAVINGVLRQFMRHQAALLEQLESSPTARYAHPAWLLLRLQTAWPHNWENIVTANNQHPPFTLRVNLQRQTRAHYLEQLQTLGIDAQIDPNHSACISLKTAQAVESLPGFYSGEVSVQDAAAQFAAPLLLLAKGQRVLDACAAPGGKTAHILEIEPALEEVVAWDIDASRLEKVSETLTRLQFYPDKKINILCQDAAIPQTHRFDRILIDAPCSATGVIRRHPDIKLLRQDSDIKALAAQQLALLNALWPSLLPDGLLVYATCSVLPEENENVITQFLAQHADAKVHPIDASWGFSVGAGRQLFPTPDGHDGFYYARLKKFR